MTQPPPAAYQPPPAQQPQSPPPSSPPETARQTSSRRLLVVVLVCGMLAAAGIGTSFVFFSQQDGTDRSTPTAVVVQFLQAAFSDRDDGKTERLTCAQWTSDQTKELRGRIESGGRYHWSAVAEHSRTEREAEVTADLVFQYSGQAGRSVQRWRFELVNDDGWRVCTAEPA